MTITEALRKAVQQALAESYYEGAVESVFAVYPDITRDEAVDIVEAISKEVGQ